jgi:ribonucleoside-diphosphate reductase alpha chain
MPYLTNENTHLYVEAYDVNPYDLIDLYAAAQKHVDQGISMTLYVTDNWTTEQLAKIYIYAWMKGIKSVYYVRQRLQTLEECVACQI